MPTILLGIVLSALAVGLFFSRLQVSWTVLFLGLALTLLFAFFFASVAANAIATTANNPASGMTMLTVIISSVVLLRSVSPEPRACFSSWPLPAWCAPRCASPANS